LRRELAPSPGRATMTLHMVVTVVLVIIVSMTLQTPESALSAYGGSDDRGRNDRAGRKPLS
jgi:ABC-type cobalt transport system substrate-binding protein